LIERSRGYDLVLVLVGALTALVGTILTELWLIPAKQHRLHQAQLMEDRLSKLYTPLVLATGMGQFSITGDIVFFKVREIMTASGYLADDEVIKKCGYALRSSTHYI